MNRTIQGEWEFCTEVAATVFGPSTGGRYCPRRDILGAASAWTFRCRRPAAVARGRPPGGGRRAGPADPGGVSGADADRVSRTSEAPRSTSPSRPLCCGDAAPGPFRLPRRSHPTGRVPTQGSPSASYRYDGAGRRLEHGSPRRGDAGRIWTPGCAPGGACSVRRVLRAAGWVDRQAAGRYRAGPRLRHRGVRSAAAGLRDRGGAAGVALHGDRQPRPRPLAQEGPRAGGIPAGRTRHRRQLARRGPGDSHHRARRGARAPGEAAGRRDAALLRRPPGDGGGSAAGKVRGRGQAGPVRCAPAEWRRGWRACNDLPHSRHSRHQPGGRLLRPQRAEVPTLVADELHWQRVLRRARRSRGRRWMRYAAGRPLRSSPERWAGRSSVGAPLQGRRHPP